MKKLRLLFALFPMVFLLGCNSQFQVKDVVSLAQSESVNLPSTSFAPKMAMLMGANGSPGNATNMAFWNDMGLRLSRIEMNPLDSTNADDLKTKGYVSTSNDAAIIFNNANGVTTFLLLAYTPTWNSLKAGDSNAGPVDESVWQAYVEYVVKKYSAAPYNVKYFQIWNEAAGSLAGGSPQATFWHGPGDPTVPYPTAMQDYVNLIHIPAAQIIRKYGAYVVYGGWPDQGGISTYMTWLEYKSTVYNSTMLDWTDYLDTHYLGVVDMDTYFKKYYSTGKIRGVWQSEVGFDYMNNHNYIANLYFQLAVMALRNGWSDPHEFCMAVYHWSGGQAFMLMDQAGNYHDSGTSLKTLTATVNGTLSQFANTITVSSGASAMALYSDNKIIFQASASQGAASIDVDSLTAPANGYTIRYIEAVFGTDLTSSITSSSWSGGKLSIRLNVPAGRADLTGTIQNTMGYVIITPN